MKNDDRIPDPEQTLRLGIEGLYEWHKEQVANGKKLFRLVQNESATDDELKSLVTHRSLLELIFTVIDLQKSLRAIVNQQKSNEPKAQARVFALRQLYQWLDENLQDYEGRLEECAEVAAVEIKGLDRGESWIRKEIALYRRRLRT